MRIINQTQINTLLNNLNRLEARRDKLMKKLSSGKEVQRPSDDPVAVARIIDLTKELQNLERYQKNINDAKGWLSTTELSLNGVIDNLTQVSSTVLRASNDTVDARTRENFADQLQQILDNIVSEANRKYNDHYVFGGTRADAAPFRLTNVVEDEGFTVQAAEDVQLAYADLADDAVTVTSADGTTTYQERTDFTIDRKKGIIRGLAVGDYKISYKTRENSVVAFDADATRGEVYRDIFKDDRLRLNLSGEEVFADDGNIFHTLTEVRNALLRNDAEELRSLNGKLSEMTDKATRFNALVGIKYDHLTTVEQEVETYRLNLTDLRSQIEDADMTQLAVDFETNETIYNAFLKAGARVIQPSLIDYMR